MTENELNIKLSKLLAFSQEDKCLEFKEAKSSYDFDKIGKYFSALCNEASLKKKEYAWLIFGIANKTHAVVGSQYRILKRDLNSLKGEVANYVTNRITFTEVFELMHEDKRIVLFQIPAAPVGIPIAWKGHYYGRDGEEHCALNIQEIEQIRNKDRYKDWSALICKKAAINDLDFQAIDFLRNKLSDIKKDKKYLTMDIVKLLNSQGLLEKGVPNNTCILSLGKEESAKFIPEVTQISWKYEDKKHDVVERLTFLPPFLLSLYKVEESINRFNTFLKDLKFMEREGGGLQKVYTSQLSKGTNVVSLFLDDRTDFTLIGKIKNEDFAKLMLKKTDISLPDLLILDRIAEGSNKVPNDISEKEANFLKAKRYIKVRGGRQREPIYQSN